jgi:hypothetical protein
MSSNQLTNSYDTTTSQEETVTPYDRAVEVLAGVARS